jgi:glycosyltransferase involved in cell wall biosynthesis
VKRDLIVFGEDWGGLPSSTQHLVRRLAPGRRVLWVNSIGLRRPRLAVRDLSRIWAKARAILRGGATGPGPGRAALPSPFPVLAPRALPLPGNPLARAFNRRVLGGQVARAAAGLGMTRPVVWISLPTALDALGALGECSVVYYCGDDFGALAGVDHAPVLRLERELVERADLVLAASARLAQRFPSGKTYLLPHGVDFGLFATPVAPAPDLPGPGPVAGFYGSLADWLDTGLLAGLARRLPDWTFLLIGEVKTDCSALAKLPNVVLAGGRAHAELPAYAQHWTAALLPFRDNDQIRASNPLKLREYLAAGRPVIATDFPALDGYRDLVAVAAGETGFAAALESAAREPPGRVSERRARVAEESWEVRATQAAGLIDALV